jgi:hypothetical protein
MRHPRLLVSLPIASVALVLAGCVAGASPAPSSAPPSSDPTAACPTAPAPNPPDPAGWPIPGTTVKASVYPVIVSSEQICGRNRLLFSFLDASNQPVASPDRSASVAFYDLGRDPATPVSTSDGTFLWAIEGSRGVYVTYVDFPEAGEWGAEFTTAVAGGPPETVRMRFQVKPTGTPVPVGATAPASVTPTAADVGGDLAKLSSDQEPEPSFYELSVDQALAQGKPFALVFATPAFCTSAQCGPTLDIVKAVATEEPGFTFINVEPYKLTYADGSLQPELDANGQLQAVPSVIDYGLLSEPWIFVVDRNGIVSASFEAIISPEELTAAIDAVK